MTSNSGHTEIHHHHHYAPGQVEPGQGGLGQQQQGGLGQQGLSSGFGQQGFQGQPGLQGQGLPDQALYGQGQQLQGQGQQLQGQDQALQQSGFPERQSTGGLGAQNHGVQHSGVGQGGIAAASGYPYGQQGSTGKFGDQSTTGAGGLHQGREGYHQGQHNNHQGAEMAGIGAVGATAVHEEHKHGNHNHHGHGNSQQGVLGSGSTTTMDEKHTSHKKHGGTEAAAGAGLAAEGLHKEHQHKNHNHGTHEPNQAGLGKSTTAGTTGTSATGVKPSLGDKIGGSIEKVVGKMTNDQQLIQEGIARKQGLPAPNATGATTTTVSGDSGIHTDGIHGRNTGNMTSSGNGGLAGARAAGNEITGRDYGVTGSGDPIKGAGNAEHGQTGRI